MILENFRLMKIIPYTPEDYSGFFNIKRMEKVYIKRALKLTKGHRPKAAEKLNITPQNLNYKIQKHALKIDLWRNN